MLLRSPTHGRPEPAATAVNLNIILEQPDKKLALFGSADRHLRMLRAAVLDHMQKKLRRQDWLSVEDVGSAIGNAIEKDRERSAGEIEVYAKGHAIKPKTEGQARYVETMFANDLTFCVGPAGTGKTYL